VVPHPVTTTLVPTAIALLSKVMGCTELVYVKAGLTWNITLWIRLFSNLARFQASFHMCDFLQCFNNRFLIFVVFILFIWKEILKFFLNFVNRKSIFFIWSTLLIYCFLWQPNFIECWKPAVMFHLGLGRDLSQDFTELLKYLKYVTRRSSVQK